MTSQQDKETLKAISSSILRIGGAVQSEILEEAGILVEADNPERDLLQYCDRSYWENLQTRQLLNWIGAVTWYLSDRKDSCIKVWGLGGVLGDSNVDLAGSGREFPDFDGKHFEQTQLLHFLNWAIQRLLVLSNQK